MDKKDKVTCVAFSSVDRYLAVGTQAGLVAIWKFMGAPRDLSKYSANASPVAAILNAAGANGSGTSTVNNTAIAAPATSAADWEVDIFFIIKYSYTYSKTVYGITSERFSLL